MIEDAQFAVPTADAFRRENARTPSSTSRPPGFGLDKADQLLPVQRKIASSHWGEQVAGFR
jgi:hypothetical protein